MPSANQLSASQINRMEFWLLGEIQARGYADFSQFLKYLADNPEQFPSEQQPALKTPPEQRRWFTEMNLCYTLKEQHGAFHIVLKETSPLPADRIRILEFIQEQIQESEEGVCLASRLGAFFQNTVHLNWREHSQSGEGMPTWVSRIFPQYEPYEHLGIRERFPVRRRETVTIRQEAAGASASSKQLAATFKALAFRFAYIQHQNRKALEPLISRLNDPESLPSATALSEETTNAVAEYLLGLRSNVLDDSNPEKPRLAIPLSPRGGNHIYAILEPNTDSLKQKWRLAGYTFPGAADENGWGGWLCNAFGLVPDNRQEMLQAMESLNRQVRELKDVQEAFAGQWEAATDSLKAGRPFSESFTKLVEQYAEKWGEVRRGLRTIHSDIPEEELSVPALDAVTDKQEAIRLHLNAAGECFARLAEQTAAYLQRLLPPEEAKEACAPGTDALTEYEPHEPAPAEEPASFIGTDLSAWRKFAENGALHAESLDSLLAPYRLLAEIAVPVNQLFLIGERLQTEILPEMHAHFGIRADIRLVIDTLCRDAEEAPEKLSFLKQMDEIKTHLQIAENASRKKTEKRNVTPEAKALRRTGTALLKKIAEGAFVVGDIFDSGVYPQPTEEEKQVIRGDRDTILRHLQAVDPERAEEKTEMILERSIQAGIPAPDGAVYRLKEVYGPYHPLAEALLLISLMISVNKQFAANLLCLLYQEKGKSEELRFMFLQYANLLPEGTRKKVAEYLLSCSLLTAAELLSLDLPLAMQEGFRSGIAEEQPELAAELSEIAGRIESAPLATHAFTDSSGLSEYVTEPDNLQQIADLKIPKSRDTLLSLVRSGDYAKGTSFTMTVKRLYEFIGNWKDIVPRLLALAPAGQDGALNEIRLQILLEANDPTAALPVFAESEALREKYRTQYLDCLIACGHYESYLAEETEEEQNSLYHLIASVRTGEWDGTLPDLSTISQSSIRLLSDLPEEARAQIAEKLAERGEAVTAYRILPTEPLAKRAAKELELSLPDALSAENPEAQRQLTALFQELQEDERRTILRVCRTRFCATGQLPLAAFIVENGDSSDIAELLEAAEAEENGAAAVLCSSPALLRAVFAPSAPQEQKRAGLAFLHRHRTELTGNDTAAILLRAYRTAVQENSLPDPISDEAEAFALRQIPEYPAEASLLVYLIEKSRQRTLRETVVLKFMSEHKDAFPAETAEWIQAENQENELFCNSELYLFEQALHQDGKEESILDYIAFCSCFTAVSDEDEQVFNSLVNRNVATDKESTALLHMLYRDYDGESAWEIIQKLPLNADPETFAKLMIAISSLQRDNPGHWKRTSGYCMENDLPMQLLQSLIEWSECFCEKERVSWTVLKDLFTVISQILLATPKEWRQSPAQVLPLTENLIRLIRMENENVKDDENYTQFCTLMKLAAETGSEELVISQLEDLLYGQYRRQSFVLFLHVVRTRNTDRIRRVRPFLERLSQLDGMPYDWLIRELLPMEPEELIAWSDTPFGAEMMNLILPFGHLATEPALRRLVMWHIENGTCSEGIRTLQRIRRGNDDPMIYTSMFILAKYVGMDAIVPLYQAVYGLLRFYPVDREGNDRRYLFSRNRRELLHLLLIVRILLKKTGHEDVIEERDRELTAFLLTMYRSYRSLVRVIQREPESPEDFLNYFLDFNGRIEAYFEATGTDERAQELTGMAMLATVTGNWTDYFRAVFREDRRTLCEQHLMPACSANIPIQNLGMMRSVCQVMKELDFSERCIFLEWIGAITKLYQQRELRFLYKIYRELQPATDREDPSAYRIFDLDAVPAGLLELPLEEHFICVGTSKNEPDEEFLEGRSSSCLMWFRKHAPQSGICAALNYLVRLSHDDNVQFAIWKRAKELFKEGNPDVIAYFEYMSAASTFVLVKEKTMYRFPSFCGMENARNFLRVPNPNQFTDQVEVATYMHEMYQALHRVSVLFLEHTEYDEEVTKTRDMSMKPVSVLNMASAMLAMGMKSRLYGLAGRCDGIKRSLVVDFISLVCSDVADTDKLMIREKYREDPEIYAAITKLLIRTGRDLAVLFKPGPATHVNQPLFLSSLENVLTLRMEYMKLETKNTRKAMIPLRAYPASDLVQEDPLPVIRDAESGLDAEDEEDISREAESAYARATAEPPEEDLPAFALAVFQEYESAVLPDLAVLKEQYGNATDLQEKQRISGQILASLMKDASADKQETETALIRFGIDSFCYKRKKQETETAAVKDFLELAVRADSVKTPASQMLTEHLPSMTFTMLVRFSRMEDALNDIRANQKGYIAVRNLMRNDNSQEFLAKLLSQLLELQSRLSVIGPQERNAESYKNAYSETIHKLQTISAFQPNGRKWPSTDWAQLRNRYSGMLQEAMSSLDRFADFSLTVLNEDGLQNGAVYGELMNTGRVSAENIRMRMTWTDAGGAHISEQYTCTFLRPGERVLFALDYAACAGTEKLEYTVTVEAGTDRSNDRPSATKHGYLALLKRAETVHIPRSVFEAENTTSFDIVDGRIVPQTEFSGRDEQIQELCGCFEGEDFSRYRNRVVAGIRRSGKSSILNYLKTYCDLNKPNLFCVMTDCQGISDSPLYTVFIHKILHNLQGRLPDCNALQALTERWQERAEEVDPKQQRLDDFFSELTWLFERDITPAYGLQGVLLVADEFDTLLGKLSESVKNNLFQTLRSIMNKKYAVRFVFCGSNNLLLESFQGGLANQFFQNIGITTVDDLPANALKSILLNPHNQNPVTLPDRTIDWIFRYTNGLVWYSKLIANRMIENVLKEGRRTAYPTDVYFAFTQICTEANCKQFYEGCDDNALKTVHMMAALSAGWRLIVSEERITAKLQETGMTGQEIATALDRLQVLRILEHSAGGYFFRKEIYRRFFRREEGALSESSEILQKQAVRHRTDIDSELG